MIRYLNMFLLALLLCLVFHRLTNQTRLAVAIAYAVSLICVFFLFAPLSQQYTPVFTLTLFATLALLRFRGLRSGKPLILFFFAMGMLTCFFDLLTFPLLTLRMPLAVLFCLELHNGVPGKRPSLLQLLQYSLLWAIGFVACWGAKWVLSSVVLQENVLLEAYQKIMHRTIGAKWENYPDADTNRLHVLMKNIQCLLAIAPKNSGGFFAMLALFFTGSAAMLGIRRHQLHYLPVRLGELLPFLLLALYPLAWYCFAANHSSVNFWFTYKLLALTIFSLLLLMIYSIGGSPDCAKNPSSFFPLQNGKKPI